MVAGLKLSFIFAFFALNSLKEGPQHAMKLIHIPPHSFKSCIDLYSSQGKSVSCDFELGNVCGWKNENFTVTQHKSPLENSGPVKAFKGEFYIYFDSEEATLELPLSETDVNCLFFAYHMWGSQMGSLMVEVNIEGQWTSVGKYEGNQGNEWHCNGTVLSESKVRVHTIKGNGLYSIIGIDDVMFFRSAASTCREYNCTYTPVITVSTTMTNLPTTFSSLLTTDNKEIKATDFITENLPLIAGIPGGLIVVLFIVGFLIVFCRRTNVKDESDDMPNQMNSQQDKSRNRYRSFPNNHPQQNEEVYDEIADPHGSSRINNRDTKKTFTGYEEVAPDGYLTPCSVIDHGVDSYLTPMSLEESEEGTYTILPAITLPIDKVMADSGGYIMPKDLNIPNRPGKKISISEQGDVVYQDVRQNRGYSNTEMESRPYLSLSVTDRTK